MPTAAPNQAVVGAEQEAPIRALLDRSVIAQDQALRVVEVDGRTPGFRWPQSRIKQTPLDVAGKESQRQHNPEEPNSHQ